MGTKRIIERKMDWPVLMREEIIRLKKISFRYGMNDCCIFCGAVIKVMTGFDCLKDFREFHKIEKYNKNNFEEVLKKIGGLEMECIRQWGEPIPSALVGRGDLCLIEGERVAICDGDIIVGPSSTDGIFTADREEIIKGWKIG